MSIPSINNPGATMTRISTQAFPEIVSIIRYQFNLKKLVFPKRAEQLFIKEPMPYFTGNSRIFKEVDTDMYGRSKKEGQQAYQTKTVVGYEKIIYVNRIGANVPISWEARKQGRDSEITTNITNISEINFNRKELDLSLVFGFATSTSLTDMDGNTVDLTTGDSFQLLYSAHTLAASATTYANRITGDPAFSKGAYQVGINQGNANSYNNLGQAVPFMPNIIISTDDEETVDEINKLFKSKADPSAANSGVYNTYEGTGLKHVVLPQMNFTAVGAKDLTKRRWWFIARCDGTTNGFQAYYMLLEDNNVRMPATGNNGEDILTDDWIFATRMTYGYGVVVAHNIFGSCPTN